MGILTEYLLGKVGYVRQAPRIGRVSRRELASRQSSVVSSARVFDAAMGGRFLGSWTGAQPHMDDELRMQLPILRARSRDVCMNNPFGINFLRKVRQNVVGPKGIRYQARARRDDGTLDERDNKLLEEAYKLSGESGNYDVTAKLSRADGERAIIETVARDGEALIRFVRGYDNEVGFAVEFINPDRLDWSYNITKDPRSGNRVVMGVEIAGFGRAVGYYILGEKSTGQLRTGVPARDMLHIFVPFRTEANRGVPWMHAALSELKHLGGYKEAAVIAARIGANQMAWIRGADNKPLQGEEDEDSGAITMPSEPGQFGQLPEDADLVSWNPEYPHSQFESFNKGMLKGISSGFGVSYPTFANDLEGTSFSSMRGGVLDERDTWMVLQDWLVGAYCRRWHREWLSYQLLARKIPSIASLPLSKVDKFRAAEFQPRRWQWVDPFKDEQANDLGVKRRTRSRSSIIRDMGLDPEEVWDEIAYEEARMKEKGIAPAADPAPAAPGQPPAPPQETDDDDED